MIINSKRKVIFYNVPRTGTLSMATAARNARQHANVPLDYVTEGHTSYEQMRTLIQTSDEWGMDLNQLYGLNVNRITRSGYEYNKPRVITSVEDLDSYEQYAFVRHPFERAKSAINLLRRGRLHGVLLQVHYGHKFIGRVSCADRDDDYDNFPQWKKDAINSIPYIQAFRHLKWWFEKGNLKKGHMGYLDGPVQPLMFDNFSNEARRVMGRLGIPANIELPHENSAKYIEEFDYLSPSQEQEIKDYFAADYEYLDSKGIHFNK